MDLTETIRIRCTPCTLPTFDRVESVEIVAIAAMPVVLFELLKLK